MTNDFCAGCAANTVCSRHGFEKNSRQIQFCMGTADTPDKGLKYWNAWEQGLSGAERPDNPQLNPAGFPDVHLAGRRAVIQKQTVSGKSKIGERLQIIIRREIGGSIPCGECKAAISRLNRLTVSDAKKKRAEIIEDIASRARAQAPKFWQRIAVAADRFLRTGETVRRIGLWLDEAIANEESDQAAARKKSANRRRSNTKLSISGPPIEPARFSEPVRRNLIYHIYPMKNNRDVWQWNLDELISRMDLFTGRRIVAIVHDKKSDSPNAVREYLKNFSIEFIELPNIKRRGEGVTFRALMERVESLDKNEVTFRAHAKGVSQTRYLPPVLKWTEMMYGVCLDDWQYIRSSLERFAITGPFRRPKHLLHAPQFYSGSFYWFRNFDVFQRNWQTINRHRAGVEIWPYALFANHEAGCHFNDGAGSLYSQKYIDEIAWPKYQEFVATHIPNRVIVRGENQQPRWLLASDPPTFQLDELYKIVSTTPSDICEHCTTLRELARRSDSVIEFGTRYGVSTIALLSGRPEKMVSYDIERKPTVDWIEKAAVGEVDYKFILGDTLKIEPIPPVDLLFIDTLHTIEQLRAELLRHGNSAKKYIVFHDTTLQSGRGLRIAINEFISMNPQWSIRADFQNNNALMVLANDKYRATA